MEQRLHLRQSQQLVMTQQLQQSLKLLQYSSAELAEFIEQELEKNPLLEAGEEGVERDTEAVNETPQTSESVHEVDAGGDEGAEMTDSMWDDRRREKNEPEQRETMLSSEMHMPSTGTSSFDGVDGKRSLIENSVSEEDSLQNHLIDQVVLDFEGIEQSIALHLVDQLDASGYFTESTADVADKLGCEVSLVEMVLERLKQADPAGVFAADLAECLALQLKDRDRLDPAMAALLKHLDLVADGDMKKLSRLCGVDEDDVRDMCAEIRTLDPKPGTQYSVEAAQAVEPDMFIFKDQAGSWKVELNPATLPRVIVNTPYYKEVKSILNKDDDKDFMSEQYKQASFIVKALHQRAQTMLKVASAIIYQQQAFFDKGIYHLKPMVFADIAEMIDMHESTVGRVVNNKYMMTPRGLFELRYFFTSGIKAATGEGGDDVSSHAVKQLIKDMIEAESPKKILSDEAIASALNDRGMNIARRTVAKYREALHIPTSAQRKRQKRLSA